MITSKSSANTVQTPAVMFGNINRLKQHLARIQCKDVIVCDGFPAEVTAHMQVALDNIKESNAEKARMRLEVAGMGRSAMAPPSSCSSNTAASSSITSRLSFLPSPHNPRISIDLGAF